MIDASPFRVYAPEECAKDGYPFAWRDTGNGVGVKDLVREQAGHRCVRCQHPYVKGAGEWSICDSRCTHGGPVSEMSGRLVELADPAWTAGSCVANGQPVRAQWRILTVHHLLLGADGKRDLRWWNLAPLCQRDHLVIQGKVQMERVWPWPHSEWFKPYAAGWYAWAYLREDLTREQVMGRLDELLALELVA